MIEIHVLEHLSSAGTVSETSSRRAVTKNLINDPFVPEASPVFTAASAEILTAEPLVGRRLGLLDVKEVVLRSGDLDQVDRDPALCGEPRER